MSRRQLGRRESRVPFLAEVLVNRVPELDDDWACARALGDAGFESGLIWRRLAQAQRLARVLRAQQADALTLPLQEPA